MCYVPVVGGSFLELCSECVDTTTQDKELRV